MPPAVIPAGAQSRGPRWIDKSNGSCTAYLHHMLIVLQWPWVPSWVAVCLLFHLAKVMLISHKLLEVSWVSYMVSKMRKVWRVWSDIGRHRHHIPVRSRYSWCFQNARKVHGCFWWHVRVRCHNLPHSGIKYWHAAASSWALGVSYGTTLNSGHCKCGELNTSMDGHFFTRDRTSCSLEDSLGLRGGNIVKNICIQGRDAYDWHHSRYPQKAQ